jgi:RNA polymerase sigma-70 factor (ECF subfamily)
MSDPELLHAALSGDEDSFRILYDRLKNGIFRYAFYMTNSRTTAEEVTQEVFMTLLKNGRRFKPEQGDLGAFTFGLARNMVHRALRREKYRRLLFSDAPIEDQRNEPASSADTLTATLIQSERAMQLRAAIAALPEHYRQAVVLCDLCELSYAEAAARLECAIGTVRSRVSRAHSLLAQKMKLHPDSENPLRDAAEGCLI